MAKFESVDDPGFISVLGELRRWAGNLGDAIAENENTEADREVDPQTETKLDGIVPYMNNTITNSGTQTFNGPANIGGTQTFHGAVFGSQRPG